MDSIKSIIESRELSLELGGYGSGIGLGLRATIPKMPSFRKKRKIPSPVRMDEDSSKRLSDQVLRVASIFISFQIYSRLNTLKLRHYQRF